LHDGRPGRSYGRLVRACSGSGPASLDSPRGRARASTSHPEQRAARERVSLPVSRGDPAGDGAPAGCGRGGSSGGSLSHSWRSGSFWPTPTQRALMEVSIGPAEEAPARWQALQPLEVTTLETGSFGLLPLLYE